MTTLVIYHGSCMDGFTAAWAAKCALPQDTEFHEMLHGDPIPDVTEKDVYVLDFSFSREVIIDLHSKAKSFLLLDHHKGAQKDLEGLDYCVFDMGRSGAGMAWDFFHKDPRPDIITYVEDQDLGKFSLIETRPFCARLSTYPRTWDNWDNVWCSSSEKTIEEGYPIVQYIEQTALQISSRASRVDIQGIEFWIVNTPMEFISNVAETLYNQKGNHPVLGWFLDHERGNVYCSLRSHSSGIDVSPIAASYGGGGHKHAAGFRVSPEWILSESEVCRKPSSGSPAPLP